MSNIRTANKRHNRAIRLSIARGKRAEKAPAEKAKQAKGGD